MQKEVVQHNQHAIVPPPLNDSLIKGQYPDKSLDRNGQELFRTFWTCYDCPAHGAIQKQQGVVLHIVHMVWLYWTLPHATPLLTKDNSVCCQTTASNWIEIVRNCAGHEHHNELSRTPRATPLTALGLFTAMWDRRKNPGVRFCVSGNTVAQLHLTVWDLNISYSTRLTLTFSRGVSGSETSSSWWFRWENVQE